MPRVVVTGASAGYFRSLATLLSTLRRTSAGTVDGIVVWDLGLRRSQRSVLSGLDGVEIADLPGRLRWPYRDWGEAALFRESYAFKPFALLRVGFPGDRVLWLDAGVAALRDLSPAFEIIERDGVFLLDNPPWRNEEWSAAECASAMRATKEELEATQIEANVVGYEVGGPWQEVFDEWLAYSTQRSAFVGDRGQHRHDQTVLSILAARYAVPLSERGAFSIRTLPDGEPAPGALFLAHRGHYRESGLAPRGARARFGWWFFRLEDVGRRMVARLRRRAGRAARPAKS
jgi:hypothetical protein